MTRQLIFTLTILTSCNPVLDTPYEPHTSPVGAKQVTTFAPDAAAIILAKCVGCHQAAHPAKGIVLEFLAAPQTDAEKLTWSVDIHNLWAGVTELTQAERDVLLEYGADGFEGDTPPEQVFFTTVGGQVSYSWVIIEDGLEPGTQGGWYQDGDFVAVINDRKWFREYDQVWFQPNAYWFFNGQDQRQHNFDIQGQVYHASFTGVVFGVTELLPLDRKARTYFEFRVEDDEWFVRHRDGDEKEEYYRGPWDGGITVSKSKPLSYRITTHDNGDGTTWLSVECTYQGAVVGAWSGQVPREIVGKVGAADYAWGDKVARVSITYTADVVMQNTGVPEEVWPPR